MFEIEYKGANSVVISTKNAKIVFDPKLSNVGLKDVSTKGAIEMLTDDRFAVSSPDTLLTLNSPGEYGVADFDIRGIAARRHIDSEGQGMMSTMYRIEVGGARIGVLGNIDKKLNDDQLEELGVLDVLIIPVGGGGYTLDAVDAASLVRTIDAKTVIPVHYADPSIAYEVPQDSLEGFISELKAPVETMAKYKTKANAVGVSALTVIELTRN
jgi:L-ascorbate metabolism protein UlaG (beta-lactamase superfamily)